MSGLVGSIPMHSRHHRPDRVPRPSSSGFIRIALPRHVAALATIVVMVLAAARPLHAQRADSARAGVRRAAADSTRAAQLPKPPLSPRRAFLYSLALPGYAQSVLGRPTAGALFVLTESIALVMLRESAADLRQAQALPHATRSSSIGYESEPVTPITQVVRVQRAPRRHPSRTRRGLDRLPVRESPVRCGGRLRRRAPLGSADADLHRAASRRRGRSRRRCAGERRRPRRAVAEPRADGDRSSAPIGVFDSGLGRTHGRARDHAPAARRSI